jgi:nucleotide-binding universal stress UspA family protein
MKPFHRILMATDFSEASGPAWRRAVAMARENEADLFVGHAYELPNMIQAGAVAPGVYDEWNENLRADVVNRLQSLVDDAKKSGVVARPLVLIGNPDEAIAKAAEENKADLVIMGTHGRKGVSRLFLGSVAARVISTAPCAVLTVRVAEAPESFSEPLEKEMPQALHA